MDKVLELVFKGSLGSKKVIKINAPKDGVTKADALKSMATLIAANIFDTAAGDLAEAVEARVRTTDLDILE